MIEFLKKANNKEIIVERNTIWCSVLSDAIEKYILRKSKLNLK